MAVTAEANSVGRLRCGLRPRRYSTYAVGEIPRAPANRTPSPRGPACAVTEAEVVEALRPVEDPELHRSIVDLGMVREVAIEPTASVGVQIALTVAGCPLADEITSRVDRRRRRPSTASRGRPRLHRHDRRGARGAARAACTATRPRPPARSQAHGHAEGRAIPFADPGSQHPGAADRLGQGRRRQVVGHHQPRRRARPSGASRSPSSTPTSGASRSRACSASTATRR